jgi:tetratricopeptide (TPR) repeat protein
MTAAPTPAAPIAPAWAPDDRADVEVAAALPPPTVPRRRVISSIDEDAMADAMASEMRHSLMSDPDSFGLPRRRRVGAWVVALVLLCGAGVLAAVVAKPYLQGLGKPAASATPLDPKALQLLTDGEKALAAGNLDAAKEDFDKATEHAENDERVLLDVARLDAVRADIPWLELRVLRPDETDETKLATQRLADLAAAAKRSADAALAVAPDDASAIRAKIDAARIAGDRDAARHLVAKVVGQAQQPETAYVLAALDLAETDPVWSTVLDRLKLAAQGEGDLGRARAALVYAYARSGDKPSAKTELDKLAALKRPYPLLAALRAFVDRSVTKPLGDGGAGPRTIDVSQLPTSATAVALVPGGVGTEEPLEGRTPTAQAMTALRKGDPSRARQILEARLAQNPNDSEAVSALGDVCRSQGDNACAIAQYKHTLAINPSYLPAMIALADVYWGSGDHGDAVRIYKDITTRFPESAYPAYVRDRAGGGAAAAATTSDAPAPAAASAAPATTDTAPAASATAAPTPAPSASAPTAPAPKASDGF